MATTAEALGTPGSGPAFCTIVAKNYLARARALSRSLRRHHPGVPLYVLLVDEAEGLVDAAGEDFILVPLSALGLPSPRELCFRYELLELCTAVKPWFLCTLFARGHPKLLYLDPDIWVYRPLDTLIDGLDEWDVILTPHLTARLDDGRYPDEQLMLLVGAYNLGFLALARGPRVDALLDWWWDRCQHECLFEPRRGLFLDQKWMNLAPSFLDRVLVLRHAGYNVAHWNLIQRKVTGTPEDPLVNGQPLHFLHASSVDPLDPSRLSCPQTRFASLEGEPLLSMLQGYSVEVLAAGHQTTRHWRYTYDYFRDGQPIHPLMRRLFREQPTGRFPDPFSADDGATFRQWAVTHVPTKAAYPPSPAALTGTLEGGDGIMARLRDLHRSRPHLRRMFPMPFVEEHDAPRFRAWLEEHAAALGWDTESVRRAVQLFEAAPGLEIAALYGRRPDVEQAFPRALLWPPDPGFLSWLDLSGRREHGLPEDWIAWFVERTHQHVCPRIVTLYRSRPEWRERHPRAFSPAGSAAFIAWVKTLPEEELGFPIGELDHICPPPAPLWELERTHRLDPAVHRAFPGAFRTWRGTERLLRWAEGEGTLRYGWEPGWHERLQESLPTRGGRAEGVTVVGYLRAESGMGELARSTVRALRQAAYPLNTVDLSAVAHRHSDPFPTGTRAGARLPFTLAVLTAPDCTPDRAPLRLPDPWSCVIGYWPWELEAFPDDMGDLFADVDEVWALSRFSATAIAAASAVPVYTVWPALPEMGAHQAPPGPLVLDPSEYNFLFVYDLLSGTDRKNPAGLLAAFRRAFRPDEPVRLTVKTINGEMRKDELRALVAAAEGLRVTVLDRYLGRPQLLGLMAACDCYASLHRAEGFGFTLAEAMALGKPVIATYYSGNTDYMTPWNCLPVPYRMAEVETRQGAYRPGHVWAEPDVEVAAELMRRAFRDREGAREVGAHGQRDVRAQLSLEGSGERMAARLRTLVDAS